MQMKLDTNTNMNTINITIHMQNLEQQVKGVTEENDQDNHSL